MRILVACEESQAVTKELRKLGHEAYSCDIMECSGGHPEWHIKGDVLPLLSPNNNYGVYENVAILGLELQDGSMINPPEKWDMIISFPPCIYLTNA